MHGYAQLGAMADVLAVVQARTGSARLPGKVMYPLAGSPVLAHVINRVVAAENITDCVVATSDSPQDDVLEQCVPRFGAGIVRDRESNVLARFKRAAKQYEPDVIVRVTGDCPLVSPAFINESVRRLQTSDIEYVSASFERTFPRGLTCEAFTAESFESVYSLSDEPHHREHVTPYYRENPDEFKLENIESSEVFDEDWLQNRTDLRLTLDEAADYQLLGTLYRELDHDGLLDIRSVVRYIDANGLEEINQAVEQKTIE